MQHRPVLVHELCQFLPSGDCLCVVDGTFGAGGHFLAISETLGNRLEIYYGLDQDKAALTVIKDAPHSPRLKLVYGLFQNLDIILPPRTYPDVVLLDLGVSTDQLKSGKRGLSVYEEGPLDMRISPEFHEKTALDLIREYSVDDLTEAIQIMTSLKTPYKVAQRLKAFSEPEHAPHTVQRCIEFLKHVLPRKTRSGLHPATSLFMMFRVLVNQEVEALEAVIPKAVRLLKPGGRLMVISFHGFEHRLVKTLLGQMLPYGKILTKKAITASVVEQKSNPSARSAQLRVFEKCEDAKRKTTI